MKRQIKLVILILNPKPKPMALSFITRAIASNYAPLPICEALLIHLLIISVNLAAMNLKTGCPKALSHLELAETGAMSSDIWLKRT